MDPIITIFSLLILLFSVIIHELAHGYVAYSLGDPTAKYAGRLTLNPLKHLDPFGSVILPLLLFISQSPIMLGWAKPVPVNPYNFKDQAWGQLKVSLAGPVTNIALAIIFGLLVRFIIIASPRFFFEAQGAFQIFYFVVQINIVLALFNLIPIPPLDGSWVLLKFLPQEFQPIKNVLQQYGFVILICLILFGGLQWLGTVTDFFTRLIIGI